ncbi:hypothetical protein G5B37_01720 [Rasiella rasia]|uniref:Lipoprotein n=1 Tax=Rasiella rasia TaxID=2744027 RepID=A0A6G6GIC4_9FLAO|nr:DUF6452 family protein [Rasiella rasia]QIE58325.1 hypothetical protein G5B37_01720 [Rasiella rasia]
MKLIFKISVVLFIAASIFAGCTRDDICDPAEAVTPLLIITFKDNANPLQGKSVTNLVVRKNNSDSTFVYSNTEPTDSIAIPLDTEMNITNLIFTLNDDDDEETTNADNLQFTYLRDEQYVNRACGFKTTYTNFTTELEQDTDNWITSFQVLQTNITDEIEAHLSIRF